jgi:hypothetical protein
MTVFMNEARNEEVEREAIACLSQGMEYPDVVSHCEAFNQEYCRPPLQIVETIVASAVDSRGELITEITESNASNSQSRNGNGLVTLQSRFSNASGEFSNALVTDKRARYQGNLQKDVRNYIIKRKGCVTKKQLWDEFSLVHSMDKANLRQLLFRLIKENIIYKDLNKEEVYWVIDKNPAFDDLLEVEQIEADIRLPLGLGDLIHIPPASIILLEGCTNAGKSAFCFNVMRDNFKAAYPIHYIYSEGGPYEVVRRIKSFGDKIENWSNRVKVKGVPRDQHNFIKQHNPDGLSVVDYVKAPDGDFTKIAPQIDLLSECMKSGIILACVQKKTGNSFGLGGEMNHMSPRTVFSLDLLIKNGTQNICSVAIKKLKYPKNPNFNPDGMERHFILRGGVHMDPITNWIRPSEQKRKQMVKEYEQCILRNEPIAYNPYEEN